MRKKLNIKHDGFFLDVPADAKLKIKRVNNIFYESKPRRSFSLSAALPLSATNNRALGYLAEPGTANSQPSFVNVELYDEKVFVHNADMQVRKTGKAYMVNVIIDYGTVDALGTDVNIRDIASLRDGSIAMPGVPDGDFYPATNGAVVYVNMFRFGPTLLARRSLETYGVDMVLPYVFVVLKEAMTYCGWNGESMAGSFMADAELQQLHFVNVNEDPDLGITFTETEPATKLPDMTITDMLEGLFTMFNAAMFFDNTNKTVRFELLKDLVNKTPVDWSSKVPIESIERDWGKTVMPGATFQWTDDYYESFSREDLSSYLDLGWHENDYYLWNTGDLNEVKRIDEENVAFVWKVPEWSPTTGAGWWPTHYLGNVSKLKGEEYIGEYPDRASLPTTNITERSIALVTQENWYYQYYDSIWVKYTHNNHSLVLGDGKRKVTCKLAPALPDRIGATLSNCNIRATISVKDWSLQEVVADGFAKKHFNEMPPMVSIYRGTGYDHAGAAHYPGNPNQDRHSGFSSPEIFDTVGTQRGNYRLTWGTDNGLYNTFHKSWYEYVSNGQEVTFPANLTIKDIEQLDLSTPVYVHGMVGFIREIEYELPLVKPPTVTIVKKA